MQPAYAACNRAKDRDNKETQVSWMYRSMTFTSDVAYVVHLDKEPPFERWVRYNYDTTDNQILVQVYSKTKRLYKEILK